VACKKIQFKKAAGINKYHHITTITYINHIVGCLGIVEIFFGTNNLNKHHHTIKFWEAFEKANQVNLG